MEAERALAAHQPVEFPFTIRMRSSPAAAPGAFRPVSAALRQALGSVNPLYALPRCWCTPVVPWTVAPHQHPVDSAA